MRGKLEVEGRRPRRNLRATYRAEGAMLSALSPSGRRAAQAAPGAGGGRAASAAPGPRGPPGNGAILLGSTTPAPGRRGRAGPAPSRPSPAEAVLAPLSGSLHQPARKAGADSAPPPGDRRPPRRAPCGRPGCCAQAPRRCGRLSRGTEISLQQCRARKFILPESQSRALKQFPVLASQKSQRLPPERLKMLLK